MAYMKGTILAVAVLLLAACGGSPRATGQAPSASPAVSSSPAASSSQSPAVASTTPTPTAGTTAIPTPIPVRPNAAKPATASCTSSIPASHELILVTLRNTAGVAVRDISDLAHPVTRCVIKGGTYFRFAFDYKISYITTAANGDGALYLVDLSNLTTSLVRTWTNGGFGFWIYAWSPDGNSLTYLSSVITSSGDQVVAWHVRSGGRDVILSQLGTIPGRGVDPNYDDGMVGYSGDGNYVAVEQTFSTNLSTHLQVVRLSDRQVVYSRPDATMATWSGGSPNLYFRRSSGVWTWDPTSGARLIVRGLKWIRPWASADGRRIAYMTVMTNGVNHVAWYLRLTVHPARQVQLSRTPRSGAAFLSPTLVWYAGEATCSATVICGLGVPPPTGRTYVFDLVTGAENASIDTTFFDSWPHVGTAIGR
jgi:WD40 repeat protein